MKKHIIILLAIVLPTILLSQENSKSLDLNNNAYINMGSVNYEFADQFTVTGWLKWNIPPSEGAKWANIVTINSNRRSDYGQFWIQHNAENNKLEFALQLNDNNRQFIWSKTEIKEGQWVHFAATYDGTKQKLYINGVEEAHKKRSGNIKNWKKEFMLTLGAWAAVDFSRNFDGEIDEISIWKKALSQDEIRTIMCKELTTNEQGLVSYFSMDQIEGTSLIDQKSGHNGEVLRATQKTSTAPIGDESVFTYFNEENSLMLNDINHSITISEFTGEPNGVHIYKVNQTENPSPIESAEIVEGNYWGIFIVGGENLTFKYSQTLNPNSGINIDDLIGLAHRNNALSTWNNQTITKDIAESTIYFYSENTFKHQEYILTKENNSPLPIELLYFNPECGQDNGVDIKWSTASETNNEYFTIYRSLDGKNWEAITEINGAGNTNTVTEYMYHDIEPTAHDTYYKLKQTDYDGKSEEFDIVAIYCKYNHKEIKIFPNPATDFINLSFINEHHIEAPLIIYVYNSSGILVHQQEFYSNPNYNEWKIDLPSHLKNGTYFMHVKLGKDYFYTNPFLINK
ncbi:MAG: T9SS type A sorting domain-containing protein [Bacteroidales bacterium]|nr:T9SS type A sorting domain-containing protein [Bacteroidales bacterium]